MKSPFFFVIAALAAVPVQASNWVFASSTDSGRIVYVDIDSIRVTGSTAQAWTKHDLSKVASEKARETKQLWRFKCADEMVALVSYVEYAPNGTVISSDNISYPEFKPVTPDTVGNTVFHIVCGIEDAN